MKIRNCLFIISLAAAFFAGSVQAQSAPAGASGKAVQQGKSGDGKAAKKPRPHAHKPGEKHTDDEKGRAK